MSTKELTDKCSLQFSSLSPQSGNNAQSASRRWKRKRRRVRAAEHHSTKKEEELPVPSTVGCVSLHAMGKEADEYISCTLTEILAVVVFKTVSLQDQASLDLM